MVAKARLVEIRSYASGRRDADLASTPRAELEFDFNPETLKVSVANNNKGGSQPGGGSGRQYVGTGTTSLSVECVLDSSETGTDVRRKTSQLARFVVAKEIPNDPKKLRMPPSCRFEWGSFIFEGIVDSMDETLEYFSEEGTPLRATVSLKLSRDDIVFLPDAPSPSGAAAPAAGTAGQSPRAAARDGDTARSVAARNGRPDDWKVIASANGIDDPLRLRAGTLLDVRADAFVSASARASAGAGAAIGASAGAAAGAAAGASAGGGARAGFSAGLGGGVGFGASAGTSAGASAGGGAADGASAGASAGFGAGVGASAGASAALGAGASAGAGAGFGSTASSGATFGAAAGAGVGLGPGVGVGVKAGTGVNAGVGASAGLGVR